MVSVSLSGGAWRGVAWRGVAWRGVAVIHLLFADALGFRLDSLPKPIAHAIEVFG